MYICKNHKTQTKLTFTKQLLENNAKWVYYSNNCIKNRLATTNFLFISDCIRRLVSILLIFCFRGIGLVKYELAK